MLNGRIAGVSGVVGRLPAGDQICLNAAFVGGLVYGPPLYALIFGNLPAVGIFSSWPSILVAGLFVGIGTRVGSGCTSGHGICGLARLSKRSCTATTTILIAGIATATLTTIPFRVWLGVQTPATSGASGANLTAQLLLDYYNYYNNFTQFAC